MYALVIEVKAQMRMPVCCSGDDIRFFSVMQVLAIVLGNSHSGTSSGLFFPQGVAGSNPMFTNVS